MKLKYMVKRKLQNFVLWLVIYVAINHIHLPHLIFRFMHSISLWFFRLWPRSYHCISLINQYWCWTPMSFIFLHTKQISFCFFIFILLNLNFCFCNVHMILCFTVVIHNNWNNLFQQQKKKKSNTTLSKIFGLRL